MFTFKNTILYSGIALLSKASAHGIVTGLVAGGTFYEGYHTSFVYATEPPIVAGWSIPEDSNWGYVSDYTSSDIICHVGATPGGAYVNVTAGDTVELQWTPWPEGHKGPMIDYLARCTNDDCTNVDKTTLLFNKIDQKGLIDGSVEPGTWASDQMRLNNNTWFTTIPPTIAPGKYVLRHETIALHQALNIDGAQNYPQCVNLEISGSGTDTLSTGTLGTALYHDTDPGLFINIYETLTNYTIPGPALYSGAVSNAQPSVSSTDWTTGVVAATASSGSSATPTSQEWTTSASSQAWTTSASASASVASTSQELSAAAASASSSSSSYESITSTRQEWTAVASSQEPSSSAAASGFFPSYANTTTVVSATRAPGIGPKPTRSSSAYHHHDHSSQLASSTEAATSIPTSWQSEGSISWQSESNTEVAPVETPSSQVATLETTSSQAPTSVSFTSTVTGRIGKPTEFVCYAVV